MAKKLTTTQKYKKKVSLLKFFSYAPFPLSIGILTAFRFRSWFAITETTAIASGARLQIGFGFILALIVFVLAVMKKVSFLKGIWGWILALAITFCLRSIINELWLILLALTSAEFIYTILESPLKTAEEQLKIARETNIQETVKKDITEEKYNGRAV
jgi:F0F1-type ATP synthase assembly protein I